jgi:hypothetical protein
VENLPEGINLNKASTPRNALGATLRPLATLYALLAEIHAFRDGNSRTRVLLLQAELTRLTVAIPRTLSTVRGTVRRQSIVDACSRKTNSKAC